MPPRNRQRPGASSPLVPRPEPLMASTEAPEVSPKPAASEPTVYLSGRVPKGLRDELQHQAIREGRPLVQLLQDAVRDYLANRPSN